MRTCSRASFDFDMFFNSGKSTNHPDADGLVHSKNAVFRMFSVMLADLAYDPEMWREVRDKLNIAFGEVDMTMVLITSFKLVYGQVEIARAEALAAELAGVLVESEGVEARGTETKAHAALRKEEEQDDGASVFDSLTGESFIPIAKAPMVAKTKEMRRHIVWGKVTEPVGGRGASMVTDANRQPKKCHCFHDKPRRPCQDGIPVGHVSGLAGLCAYMH